MLEHPGSQFEQGLAHIVQIVPDLVGQARIIVDNLFGELVKDLICAHTWARASSAALADA